MSHGGSFEIRNDDGSNPTWAGTPIAVARNIFPGTDPELPRCQCMRSPWAIQNIPGISGSD